MTIDRATQLLNAELDGELGACDRKELQALLVARPELDGQREALQNLTRTLRQVADLDPPPGMAQHLAASISLPSRRRPSWRLPGWQLNPRALPFAALAAALVVAVGGYWSLPQDSMLADATAMVGTVVHDSTPATPEPRARLELGLDELSGQVTLATPAANTRLLEFELSSAGAVDIAIQLAGSGLVFGGFSLGENGVELIATDATTLHLRSQGERRFAVVLRAPTAAGTNSGSRIGLEFSGQQGSLLKGALISP